MFLFFLFKFSGARTRYRSEESRILHDDLVRQAEERARLQKLDRYHSSLQELQVIIYLFIILENFIY